MPKIYDQILTAKRNINNLMDYKGPRRLKRPPIFSWAKNHLYGQMVGTQSKSSILKKIILNDVGIEEGIESIAKKIKPNG